MTILLQLLPVHPTQDGDLADTAADARVTRPDFGRI